MVFRVIVWMLVGLGMGGHPLTMPLPAEPPVDPVDQFFRQHGLPEVPRVQVPEDRVARQADSVLTGLSLEELIGQLFVVDLPVQGHERLRERAALDLVRTHHVGGFLVRRRMPPRAVRDATRRLQAASRIPLFFAADFERGAGRFDTPLTELPSNMALGATRDTVLAGVAGRLTALESRAVGVNLLFGPVVDVNSNPANPIINIRSYGEDPVLVGRMGAAFVREAEAHGLLTTLKHFPGHGNTSVDSHARMGAVAGDRGSLARVELWPFRYILSGPGAAAVMSAHLWVPAYDPRPLPATFSRRLLQEILRDSLGFQGLVVTDDVKMGALSDRYTDEERVVRPLLAGADVILTPGDLPAARRAIRRALREGRLTRDRLEASVRRILRAKARAGLFEKDPPGGLTLDTLLTLPLGEGIAEHIAGRAVTLLKDNGVLPLPEGGSVALFQFSNHRETESIGAAMDLLAQRLTGGVRTMRWDRDPSRAEVRAGLQAAEDADAVVVALFLRLRAGEETVGLSDAQAEFIRRLTALERPVVLVVFGNPYAVARYPGAAVHLVAYDPSLASVQAVTQVLAREIQPAGRLPVTAAPYPYGAGYAGGR